MYIICIIIVFISYFIGYSKGFDEGFKFTTKEFEERLFVKEKNVNFKKVINKNEKL